MIDLGDEFLRFHTGTLARWPSNMDNPVAGTWSITLPLEPFSADDEFQPDTFRPGGDGPELITTEISLDFIALPASSASELAGRSFVFPPNPHDGYIDGSIYLIACHCPVDVTQIDFGDADGDTIAAALQATFDFDRAGGINIRNRTARLDVMLRYEQR